MQRRSCGVKGCATAAIVRTPHGNRCSAGLQACSECSRIIMRRMFALIVTMTMTGATLAAHDMWIEPTAFIADGSKVLGIRLRVGENLVGSPLPRDSALIDQFVVVDAAGTRPV